MKTPAGTWIYLLLVSCGGAWTLGLHTAWWQRALAVFAVLVLAVADASHTAVVSELRERTARGLDSLSPWIRGPLAIAGGAWIAGLNLPVTGRVTLAAAVLAVLLFERSMSAATVTRSAR
ncbi:hypothetical protein ACFPK5_00860 [Streptomyces beijiangensis]|uniref:hypothetical protein n=1 Tax=Streptomyces beijiangensis TaxID=163361 RepID=UPI0031D5BFC7